MATRATIVVVQSSDCVEPKQPAQLGASGIDRATKAPFQCGFNVSGETQFQEPLHQLLIQSDSIFGGDGKGWRIKTCGACREK